MRPGLTESQIFTISSNGAQIQAPLPESFSLGTGSELSEPFSIYGLTGELQKFLYLYNSNINAGMAYTKFWSGPTQPDISVNLKFNAYTSALEDVMIPTVSLLVLASPQKATSGNISVNGHSITDIIASLLNAAGSGVNFLAKKLGNSQGNVLSKVSSASLKQLFAIMHSPGMCRIHFGTTVWLSKMYITALSVEYTNVLEYTGYPMEANVSVTFTPQQALSKSDFSNAFGAPIGKNISPNQMYRMLGGSKNGSN